MPVAAAKQVNSGFRARARRRHQEPVSELDGGFGMPRWQLDARLHRPVGGAEGAESKKAERRPWSIDRL